MNALPQETPANTDGEPIRRSAMVTRLWRSIRTRLDSFLPTCGLLIVVFYILQRTIEFATRIPHSAYEEPFILGAVLRHLPHSVDERLPASGLLSGLLLFVIAVAAILLAFFVRRQLTFSWSDLTNTRAIRAIIIAAAAVLAWSYSTYSFNYFYDQSHVADRAILIVLFALTCWRPVFVLPFVITVYAIIWQFSSVPTIIYPVGELRVPLNILILFASAILISSARVGRPFEVFPFVLCCLVAGHYWTPGAIKLGSGWLLHNHIEFFLPATHANGWLGWLSPQQISSLTGFLAFSNPVMKLFAIGVECGALFMLFSRRLAIALTAAWIAFHVGIFFVSGICIWMWVVCNACLLILLLRSPSFRGLTLFSPGRGMLGIGLILLAPWWLRTERLSWFDSPVNYVFRFEAETEDGERCSLPPLSFGPYSNGFTFSAFTFLDHQPTLDVVWSATSRATAEKLTAADSVEEVFALERELGMDSYDEKAAADFTNFLREYIGNRNAHLPVSQNHIDLLKAPPLLWTFSGSDAWRGQKPIRRIEVFEVVSYYDGEQYREIRKRRVLETEIPAP